MGARKIFLVWCLPARSPILVVERDWHNRRQPARVHIRGWLALRPGGMLMRPHNPHVQQERPGPSRLNKPVTGLQLVTPY